MSGSGSSSSDLSELQDGVVLRSEDGDNDSAADSEPDTEAETERLDPSPQKLRDAAVEPDIIVEDVDEDDTSHAKDGEETIQPGLTAQDLLGSSGPLSDNDEDMEEAGTGVKSPPELAGKKRKRSTSTSALANGTTDGAPLKKRTSSTRSERRSSGPMKNAIVARQSQDDAIAEESSPEEAQTIEETAENGAVVLGHDLTANDESGGDAANGDIDDTKEEATTELSEGAGDEDQGANEVEEEEAEAEGEGDEAEAEVEATAKSEDEMVKKKQAMDALIPIEKLFAVFRDKLYEERWAHLGAEIAVLNDPDTNHPEYLAMRQVLDARREEKLNLEQIGLGYKIKALENRIVACRAQIHSQYFQTVRKIREEYMEKLNEQFTCIQRERRQWKTKEPHFAYNFETKRSKQITQQTAYNKEVSLLSGIAKHVGFPSAPEIHGVSSNDIDEDLRAMKIQPQTQSVSYSRLANSARADEAAAEEQFIEKTPWANPQHPAHNYLINPDRRSLDGNRSSVTTPSTRVTELQRGGVASDSTVAVNSDPPSGLAQPQADAAEGSSSPVEHMKRQDREVSSANPPQPRSMADDNRGTNSSLPPIPSGPAAPGPDGSLSKKPEHSSSDVSAPPSTDHKSAPASSSQTAEALSTAVPRPSAGFTAPTRDQHPHEPLRGLDQEPLYPATERERYQSPSLVPASTDNRFAGSEALVPPGVGVGVARSFGVR